MPLDRRTALKGLLATTIGAVAGATVYGGGYERHRIGVTGARLFVRGLPGPFEGLRIAFITDIHHSVLVPAEDVLKAVALANDLRPDLVILGGDYVSFAERAYVQPVAEMLAGLRGRLGVVAILGNHDDDREMAGALAGRGIEVLRDRRRDIVIGGEVLELAGIRFWTRKPPEIAAVVKGARGPVLLLSHDPRRLVEAALLDVAAVLSGHTHGGQIVIPGLGALAARKFPVPAGLGARGSTSIFVSRGVGTVYLPVRINCPPEVALVTLTGDPRDRV